jgi:hypothetical protein
VRLQVLHEQAIEPIIDLLMHGNDGGKEAALRVISR